MTLTREQIAMTDLEKLTVVDRTIYGNPSGTKYEEGVWDQAQRTLGKIRKIVQAPRFQPAPPSDVVDAVARAMWDAEQSQFAHATKWELADEDDKHGFRVLARAAIEAMRLGVKGE